MNFLVNHNEDIFKVWKNYRGNLKLTSPDIQKDIVKAAANVTTQVILHDLGDDLFSILIDESRDISVKEQMVVVIRYVNNEGKVIERFLGVVHVSNTSDLALKSGLESLFAKYGLSLSRIRGQGYDRATLVTLAKKHSKIASFFNLVANLYNVVGASCKCRDILRESQATKVKQALEHGEISSGRGLNQEMTIKKVGETRWSSHYGTLLSIVSLFSSMIDVLEMVEEDGIDLDKKVIDRQLQELDNRFTEVNIELLLCVAYLSPRDSFSAFDKERLIRLAQFYPSEFSQVELLALYCQVENYLLDVYSASEFLELEGIGDLSIKLVETKNMLCTR
ncbi:hypothetical protein KIW84_053199 [Lathyrus oleraceus]|uniref:DUF4371 domain-containing protein n=1 Tax=Pisum sativum TaxID=3888 RepID=A0A9D5AGG0_PEA|nr:hypothetical protein KIW84_053199 [Pisum sativum]